MDHGQPKPVNQADYPAVEEIELRGHIIDSLILPKVLDVVIAHGGVYTIKKIAIGSTRQHASHALVEVRAPNQAVLETILGQLAGHGAVSTTQHDARLVTADVAGAFPEEFYSTTNQRTEVRLDHHWHRVADQEMDCGIVVDPATKSARCIAMTDVELGMQLVCGHAGVRVFPEDIKHSAHSFEFMNSAVSTEKPKGVAIRQIAQQLFDTKRRGGKSLLVGGPAIIHTGSSHYVGELIQKGYLNRLFAGNALATHDIEQSIYGTSLGVDINQGESAEAGHEHHLRAINRIRRAGSIRAAVDSGIIKSGIMYECVKNNVEFTLCGSIRDDGPLPDVITDTLVAQRIMRAQVRDIDFCLMIATTLHSIAVGNLLPAWVKVVCVDINPSTVIKLNDRGSFQTVGLVTDVEPFLRSLIMELRALESAAKT